MLHAVWVTTRWDMLGPHPHTDLLNVQLAAADGHSCCQLQVVGVIGIDLPRFPCHGDGQVVGTCPPFQLAWVAQNHGGPLGKTRDLQVMGGRLRDKRAVSRTSSVNQATELRLRFTRVL